MGFRPSYTRGYERFELKDVWPPPDMIHRVEQGKGREMVERVRCKFRLNTVTEKIGQKPVYGDPANPQKVTGYRDVSHWDAQFTAVYGGTSDENSKFWDYTPAGSFQVTTINRMPWEIGKEYYIDITGVTEG